MIHHFKFLSCLLLVWLSSRIANAQYYDDYKSSEGKGLNHYKEPTKIGTLEFVEQIELDDEYRYAKFYENPFNNKLYLYRKWNDLKEVADFSKIAINTKGKKQEKTTQKEEMILDKTVDVGEIRTGYYGYSAFISAQAKDNEILLEIPQHHLSSSRPQVIASNRPGFKLDLILQKINGLGLKKSETVQTAGGFNVLYDRLFINDEAPDKLLVIWSDRNKIFANFLSNAGAWEYPEPKVIHTDVRCYDANGQVYQRDIEGATDKSTLVTELNSIKSGDTYYVGYSLASWEASTCFRINVATCHLLKLNSKLEVEQSVQLPPSISKEENKLFAQDLQMQLCKNKDTLCAVIQSPNAGKDKLFVIPFNKDLKPGNSMLYISNTSSTYDELIPVVTIPGGFLLNYKETRKNSTEIYTHFISSLGYAATPVSVLSSASLEEARLTSFYVKLVNKTLHYYVLVRQKETNKPSLFHYQLPLDSYWKYQQYKITKDNWKEDKQIMETDKLVSRINNEIEQKMLIEFKRDAGKREKKKAFVSNEFQISCYQSLYAEESLRMIRNLYYDQHNTLRMASIVLEQNPRDGGPKETETILVYYNTEGMKIWEIKTNAKGEVITEESKIRSSKYLRINKEKPYEEFHSNNNN